MATETLQKQKMGGGINQSKNNNLKFEKWN